MKVLLRRAHVALGMLLVLACFSAHPALAAITLSGDTVPTSTGGADPWNIPGALRAGISTPGSIMIDGGSDVTSGSGFIGDLFIGVGVIEVNGAGSTWGTISTHLTVGNAGNGELHISAGGAVSSAGQILVGAGGGSFGEVTVSDVGTTLTSASSISVGAGTASVGTFKVMNGATASSGDQGQIGAGAGSVGTVTVDGGASTWTIPNALSVGVPTSLAQLNITGGGRVVASSLAATGATTSSINFDNGTLQITGNDSATDVMQLNAGGGTLEIDAIKTFTLNTDSLGDGVGGTGPLTKAGAGTLALAANNTYNGNTNVNTGTLTLTGDGSFASSPTIVVKSGAILNVAGVTSGANHNGTRFALASGQTLKGNGTVSGAMAVSSGATLAPGESIGSLATSAVTLATGSTLDIELDLGAPLAADLLDVTGAIALTGSILNLTLLNAPPLLGGSEIFLIALNDGGDTVSGTFASLTGVPIGYSATINYSFLGTDILGRIGTGNDIAVTIVPVPEPHAWLLGLIASAVMMVALRARGRAMAQ